MTRTEKKKLYIWAIVTIFICIIMMSIIMFAVNRGEKRTAILVFQKDSQINFMYPSKKESVSISDNLYENETKQIEPVFIVADNGKKMFYSDNINGTTYNLYYKNLKKDDEGKKIADNVSNFKVNAKGNKVYYIADNTLHTHNIKESSLVAKNVNRFYIDKKGKKVLYLSDKDLYYKSGSKDATKLDSDVTQVEYTPNFKKVAYISGGSLYIKDKSKDAVNVADDVSQYIMYDNGHIMYIVNQSLSVKYTDIIKDTKVGELAPENGTPEYYNYKIRETLRKEVLSDKDARYQYDLKSMYYYDGKESKEYSGNIGKICKSNYEEKVILYTAYESVQVPKLDIVVFNEYLGVQSKLELEQYITNLMFGNYQYHISVDGMSYELGTDALKVTDYAISDNGKHLYYVENAILYKQKISNRGTGKKEEYSKNVSYVETYENSNDVVYIRDYAPENNKGTLCVNKKVVDTNVYVPGGNTDYIQYLDGTFAYLCDYTYEKKVGVLKLYNKNKATSVCEDIENNKYYLLQDKSLAYISDGQLHITNGKQDKKIADGVEKLYKIQYDAITENAYYNQ